MCSPVYALACLLVGTVCRGSGLLGMHILILRLASDTCRIPDMLVAWIGELYWWYCCLLVPSLSVAGV